jgi:uncharacterized phage protein gp47/JayE
MAISIPDLDTLVERALTAFRVRFPGKDTHSESFLGKHARALAMTLLGFLQAVKAADDDAVPSERTSSAGLDAWAYALGLPADTSGSYGRKGPTAAGAGLGLCTGTLGTVFPDETVLTAPDGVTEVQLLGAVRIPGTPPGAGSVLGSFVAITKGKGGNLDAGTVLTWQSPPSGADSTVVLTSPLRGALDGEDDPRLLVRELERLQKPPKGGAASDYRRWAESVPGVLRAYVYPLRGGTATVHVVITAEGSGAARVPSVALQSAVDAYVNGSVNTEGTRPTTVEGYATLLPTLAPKGMAIQIRVAPSLAKYAFDWQSAGAALSVVSYTAGPPAQLVVASKMPPSFVTAVGLGHPRIQVLVAGSALPLEARCIGYTDSTQTITLDTPLATSPQPGDTVYPSGPLVAPVAASVLAYVDSLGPSRASGYADPNDLWEDTCSIFRIASAALAARDADGTPLADDVLAVTIDGATTSRTATDFTDAGPELLYFQSLVISD